MNNLLGRSMQGSVLDRSTMSSVAAGGHAPFRILGVSEPRPMDKKVVADTIHTDHETREVQILEDKIIEIPKETIHEKIVEV